MHLTMLTLRVISNEKYLKAKELGVWDDHNKERKISLDGQSGSGSTEKCKWIEFDTKFKWKQTKRKNRPSKKVAETWFRLGLQQSVSFSIQFPFA